MRIIEEPSLRLQFDSLIETYAELLVGDKSEETLEQVKLWALFNHIHKTMPALTNHWNASHPEAKAAVRELFEHVKALNQQKNDSKPSTST